MATGEEDGAFNLVAIGGGGVVIGGAYWANGVCQIDCGNLAGELVCHF